MINTLKAAKTEAAKEFAAKIIKNSTKMDNLDDKSEQIKYSSH
jgi:hypothetical protein